jgi:predicted nuclease with RNAse H fold
MTHAERFLELGLRLGKHVDGLVDSYYGPAELKAQVDAEETLPAAQLAGDAESLRDELQDGWLRDEVAACATYARVLAGDCLSYSDEVERCYGVRPSKVSEDFYAAVHAELDELYPGSGSLRERRDAWKERHLVAGELAVPVLEDLLPLLRARTEALLIDLPEGEALTLEPVTDEPWWAFNYYLGDLRSRVVLNVDVPTTGADLIHLAGHEVYPGHHTEHSVKEQLLMREQGRVEEAIKLVPTPHAVVSEGIAETGADLILDDAAKEEAYAILRRHGVTLVDPALSERISKAFEGLRTVGLDAALMIHEEGASVAEAEAYVERWSLSSPEQAAHSVRFVTDPTWRAYVITYSAGRDLCRAYVAGDPARFRTLLTEHVRIGDLLEATG